MASLRARIFDETMNIETDPRDDVVRPSPIEDLVEVLMSSPEKTVRISSALSEGRRAQIIALLREYEDLFAWKP